MNVEKLTRKQKRHLATEFFYRVQLFPDNFEELGIPIDRYYKEKSLALSLITEALKIPVEERALWVGQKDNLEKEMNRILNEKGVRKELEGHLKKTYNVEVEKGYFDNWMGRDRAMAIPHLFIEVIKYTMKEGLL